MINNALKLLVFVFTSSLAVNALLCSASAYYHYYIHSTTCPVEREPGTLVVRLLPAPYIQLHKIRAYPLEARHKPAYGHARRRAYPRSMQIRTRRRARGQRFEWLAALRPGDITTRGAAPRAVFLFAAREPQNHCFFTHTSARTHPHRAMWDRRASTLLSACASCPCAAVANAIRRPAGRSARRPYIQRSLRPVDAHIAQPNTPATACARERRRATIRTSHRSTIRAAPDSAATRAQRACGTIGRTDSGGAASGNGAQAGTGVRRVHSQAARRIADRRRWARCEKGVGALRREAMVL